MILEIILKLRFFQIHHFELVKINSSKLINKIDCFDIKGQLIASKNYDDASVVFNVNKFAKGIYFLKISAEDGTSSRQKIVRN